MSSGDPPLTPRSLRADAERNIESILHAALKTLAERPEATMEDIARAGGVARQTIYAHFSSREALIRAVQEQALNRTIAILDTAQLDAGPPDEALERLLDVSWATAEHYRIFDLPPVPTSPEEEYEGHRPLLERLERLIRRGQDAGVFDRRLPVEWLAAAFISLAHTAGQEVTAGRMTADEALQIGKRSLWRLYGIDQ